MCARLIRLLIVVAVTSNVLFTQSTETPIAAARRIIIKLPRTIPSDALWIRYLLNGHGSAGLRPKPNLREYVIYVGPHPGQYAKIVIYAAGCRFGVFDLYLDATSDVTEHFECEPLPMKGVRGFIPPTQIPSSVFATEKRLDIVGETRRRLGM